MAACDKRHKDRSNLRIRGVAIRRGLCLTFTTIDLSLNGACVEVREEDAPRIGTALRVRLLSAGFNAKAIVRWTHSRSTGMTVLGLQFIAMDFLNSPPPGQATRPVYYA